MTNQEAINVLFNEWKCIDRNDGIHCDRKCESCDLVMDVEIIREAYNMAISALQAQEAKTQLSAEGTTSDCISRQAAIDVCNNAIDLWHGQLGEGIVIAVKKKIEQLPPAQPETHEERTETHACDLIDRQAAIDALHMHLMYRMGMDSNKKRLDDWINGLPSAQPEIIRCKDCENWIPGYITDNDDFIPPKCGKYQQMVGHSSDDYCSLAERRTDDQSK